MGGKIESYVLELVSLPTLGIASTVLVEGNLCGILRTIQNKYYEERFCCLSKGPLPLQHQCLKPKLAELAEQYFAFRPCSIFKEAIALKRSLDKKKINK